MPTWRINLGLIRTGMIRGVAQGLWVGCFGVLTPVCPPQYSPSMRATYLAVTDEHIRQRGDFPA